MVRSALMFVLALGVIVVLVSPDSDWAPVATPVAAVESAAIDEPLPPPETPVVEEGATPSFIVPVKRVAFPTIPTNVAVETEADATKATSVSQDVRIVTAEALNIRDRPSSSSNVVGKLIAGDAVTVVGEERSWLQVTTANGLTGWISSRFVKPS